MLVLRTLFIVVGATSIGCYLGNLIAFGDTSFATIGVTSLFGLLGSLLLTARYAASRQSQATPVTAYGHLLATGAFAGGLMMILSADPRMILVGSLYGILIAIAWVVLHRATGVLRPRGSLAANGSNGKPYAD